MLLDMAAPQLKCSGNENNFKSLQSWLVKLIDNINDCLCNIDDGNLNDTFLETLTATKVVAQTVISNTIITNELYSEYGSVANLAVDELRTDFDKAQRYLKNDTSQLDYIYIHDEQIKFITATTDGLEHEQLKVNNEAYWWTDEKHIQMTKEEKTGLPVLVYKYKELTKAAFEFQNITLPGGTVTAMPVLTFGAGNEVSFFSKAKCYKNNTGFVVEYRTNSGDVISATFDDNGFIDTTQRRLSNISVSGGVLSFSLEGETINYDVPFVESAGAITFNWPDGFQTVVTM